MKSRTFVAGFALSALILFGRGLVFGAPNLWLGDALRLRARSVGAGGPDDYGYTWIDSDTAGGPTFGWVDITGTGTEITGLSDDNVVGPFALGFDFPYYWYTVNQFWVSSNGEISFSSDLNVSPHDGCDIPNPTLPNDLLAPLWGDLTFDAGGQAYYYSNGTDTCIISYLDVPEWHIGSPGYYGSHTFQIVLTRADSVITFQYGYQEGTFDYGAPVPVSDGIGMENVSGLVGLQYLLNNYPPENMFHDSLAIDFIPPDSTAYEAHDMAVAAVMNAISGGFFMNPGDTVRPWAVVRNVGNQPEGGFDVTCLIRRQAGPIVMADTVTIASIAPGEEDTLNFALNWVPMTVDVYAIEVACHLPGDMNTNNDFVAVEARTVNYPSDLAWDDDDMTYGLAWYGTGGGYGNRFVPPFHPTQVTHAKAYIVSVTTPPANIRLKILDDDGPWGTPGTLLASRDISVTVAPMWYIADFTADNIQIPSGSFYVGYEQLASQDPYLGMDSTGVFSRQGWEYVTGTWARYRSLNVEDIGLRAVVDFGNAVEETPEVRGHPSTSLGTGMVDARLLQNYPNPFTRTTTIPFALPSRHADAETRGPGDGETRIQDRGSHINLSVYDLGGRLIRTLLSYPSNHPPIHLSHRVVWDGRDSQGREVPSGVYFYRLSAGKVTLAKKLTVLR